MKNFFRKNWWVALILGMAHLAQFWPFYFQRLLPFPGDTLVAFYFPWSGGGFAGFDPWTQYKALNTVDVIKQFYPWKIFAFDLLHRGVLPLWNPFSFSGMPFIANLQSGIFFVTNLIYLFLPTLWGWVGNILLQLFAFGLFSYLFLRSEKLSRLAAVFGAVVIMNLSYITLWHWQLVITQSALFLPLILWSVNKYVSSRSPNYLILNSILLALSFLGGHAQTTIYVFMAYCFFAIFRRISIVKIIITCVIPVGIAAIQLAPSLEAYLLSAREGAATKELFAPFVFPWRKIISMIAPNFFGHPTNRNYFGIDYRDFNAYYGATAFIFSVLSLNWLKTVKTVRFFLLLAIFGLLFATKPLAFVFDVFNFPVLSSGVPARMIFLFQFSGAVLAAYGFEYWLKEKAKLKKGIIYGLVFVGVFAAISWALAISNQTVAGQVSRNNLILPSALIFLTTVLVVVKNHVHRFWWLCAASIFVLSFFQYSYFFQQYNSFAPEKFVFPKHPVLEYLQNNSGINRFFGTENAIFDYNFSVYYKLFDFGGYDSMYPRRYGELIASAPTAKYPTIVPRSDAFINHWSDRQSERLLDLLGVKYLLDKDELITSDWDEQPSKFSPDRYRLLWQLKPWRIYQRLNALPRIALFGSYQLETSNPKIIEKLYSSDFDYKNQLILEKKPAIDPRKTANAFVNLISYEPNTIKIQTKSDAPQLLFLSDSYYSGWRVFVDKKEKEILRANYTFRAVDLEKGDHEVVFTYDPVSFKIGLVISVLSIAGIGIFILWRKR